jgi:hypothetical protein
MGYYGGNPETILDSPLDIVLSVVEFESFDMDFFRAYNELNKEER